jgi:hypothetical protein
MTLGEIRRERGNTRLKTKRWHELNQMERARVAELNGDPSKRYHDLGYHKAQVSLLSLPRTDLMSFVHRARDKKLLEHHQKMVGVFSKEN